MAHARTFRTALAWIAGTVGTALALGLAGLPVYVFPPSAQIHRADVVQVLGPALDERVEEARQLVADGYADLILVSVPPPGEPASSLGVCREAGVTCATPDPYTTDGETVLLERFVRAHGLESAIVLTGTGHVSRARYIYSKCYPGDATVVAVARERSLLGWIWTYAYQTGAFMKAFVTPCAQTPAD